MSRRNGRVIAFQALYSWDVSKSSLDDLLTFSWLQKDAEIEALKAELDYIKKDQTSAPKCPWCGSTQIQALNQGFSAGKALGGAILFGGIGLLAGAAGMNKTKRVCLKCGRTI